MESGLRTTEKAKFNILACLVFADSAEQSKSNLLQTESNFEWNPGMRDEYTVCNYKKPSSVETDELPPETRMLLES